MEDRLQKFTALVDAETFTAAAEILHISQPALSAAIRKLERELGVELLVRTGNRFRLTSAGRLAYIEGKELATRRKNLKLQLANLKHEKVALAIGMIDSIADALFAEPEKLFAELEKTAEISLSINNSAFLQQAVKHGRLDIAIIARQSRQLSSQFEVKGLGTEPLIFVVHAMQQEAVQAQLREGVISHFLSYNQTSTTHQLILAAAEHTNIELHPTFYSTSPEIILGQVLQQKGMAALPQLLVGDFIREGRLVPVRIGGSHIVARDIVSLKATNRQVPAVVHDILDQAEQLLAEQMAASAHY